MFTLKFLLRCLESKKQKLQKEHDYVSGDLHAQERKDEDKEEEEEEEGEDGGYGVHQSHHQISQRRPVPGQ